MDKSELKKVADSVFERYPNVDKVFVTSDGQAFFEEAHAKNHAAQNKKHKELEIETFRHKENGDFDIDNLDRAGLESFIKENSLQVEFDENIPDEDLRDAIVAAIEAEAKAKKPTKKAKK
ncbi:hypothetical protein FACS1894179_06980 [Bacteroidia bacterium]|nr:hypothetical protein FACS1894179_06980 [Bacteroidia bacterium]